MRILAIDVGERRVGLAISDPTASLARPLETIERAGSLKTLVTRVANAIGRLQREEDGLERIVIGLPRRLDGTPTAQTSRVRAFAEALDARIRMPIVFQDERLSSREAESRLAVTERDWRKRKPRLDAASAAVILQDYLDRPAS